MMATQIGARKRRLRKNLKAAMDATGKIRVKITCENKSRRSEDRNFHTLCDTLRESKCENIRNRLDTVLFSCSLKEKLPC